MELHAGRINDAIYNPHDILVNGQFFPITKNLEAALRRVRLPDLKRTLWIDSVCINQGDISEVNIQVQRIWAIYQHARRVLVFLGDEADDSRQAFVLSSQLSQVNDLDDVGQRITALLNDENMETCWEALYQLLRRPWWSRAWTIQEYVVAKSVVFQCGSIELDGEAFGKALDVMVEYRFSSLVPARHLYLARHVPPTPIIISLNTLYRFRESNSFDARDKVYSLYRLIAENPKLAPDYTKRVQDLFKDVVGAMIESSGTLEVLSHHSKSNQTSLPGLPTWCPDWTVMRGKRMLLWPNEYHSTGPERNDPEPAFAQIDGGTLTLKGKLVQRIRWLKAFESDDLKDEKYIYNESRAIETAALRGAAHNLRMENESADHAATLDAFRRTLVASRIRKTGANNIATVLGPREADELWDAWCNQLEGNNGNTNQETTSWYTEALYGALCGRAFFVFDGGQFGLVDESAQAGDVVGVFLGARVLFFYLHGLMSGRAISGSPDRLSDIELV
ncbi:heterokaryon incompatibility protein-domain-containing protein [Podospora didyma]|uniref:Heterokaryon incompatibility protein-domain-containing protein n=1 Tax=Podospora didyma TaxID=330526 RepID=A0AAE0NC16_9PEZI|nr:heterokaryon incompatibility protein-domain-containing protein [Podospora didyma]